MSADVVLTVEEQADADWIVAHLEQDAYDSDVASTALAVVWVLAACVAGTLAGLAAVAWLAAGAVRG